MEYIIGKTPAVPPREYLATAYKKQSEMQEFRKFLLKKPKELS